jgi:N-dimethylarginine dimethylaminohydrolase
VKGCEDMVFAANQSFPWVNDKGEKVVIMSKMKHASRQGEVKYFEELFVKLGYKILKLSRTKLFEGMGDTIPHPGKKLLYGGFGHRTDPEAYLEISGLLNVIIIPLELKDERFYHLDTCFLPFDEDTVMICREAFTLEGIKIIEQFFKKVIYIPMDEASTTFALNAHIISDKNNNRNIALIQKGNNYTVKYLKENQAEVVEVDTSEYIKSGGSVFCMKMMVY